MIAEASKCLNGQALCELNPKELISLVAHLEQSAQKLSSQMKTLYLYILYSEK